MKKYLLSALLLIPMVLQAIQQPQDVRINETFLVKGKTTRGTALVKKVWDHIAEHKWNRVKNDMHKDFSSIDSLANHLNRTNAIQFWKSLHIQKTEPFILDVQAPKKDVLIVIYGLLRIAESQDPELADHDLHLSLFKKEHGRWLWLSDSNYNN